MSEPSGGGDAVGVEPGRVDEVAGIGMVVAADGSGRRPERSSGITRNCWLTELFA